MIKVTLVGMFLFVLTACAGSSSPSGCRFRPTESSSSVSSAPASAICIEGEGNTIAGDVHVTAARQLSGGTIMTLQFVGAKLGDFVYICLGKDLISGSYTVKAISGQEACPAEANGTVFVWASLREPVVTGKAFDSTKANGTLNITQAGTTASGSLNMTLEDAQSRTIKITGTFSNLPVQLTPNGTK
jgi:hypothetical protein